MLNLSEIGTKHIITLTFLIKNQKKEQPHKVKPNKKNNLNISKEKFSKDKKIDILTLK